MRIYGLILLSLVLALGCKKEKPQNNNGHSADTTQGQVTTPTDPGTTASDDSLTEKGLNLRAVSMAKEMSTVASAFTTQLRKGENEKVNKLIHPEKGFFYVERPGAMDVMYHCKQFGDIWKHSPHLKGIFSDISCLLKISKLPEFNCDTEFETDGCFLYTSGEANRLSELIEFQEKDMPGALKGIPIDIAKELEASASVQLLETKKAVTCYFGKIDGKWYLLILDRAQYSCSA